ncbi:uncharacterized protein LOC116349388 [Contarinia nasturtii]|uniref:uncharacterized protein LOC116349388 n=1 Tax=Contarinia nasturtii TaxID=265458 RepID=UPI0012D3F96C|nr:uncharacterized protein LOC116349388 [Contarinia nasturtii]
MAKHNGVFWVSSVHFSVLMLTILVGPSVLARDLGLNVHKLEPIKLKFPDIPERKGPAAIEYVNDLLTPLKSGASDKDPNLIMTGESCARGLGSLYIVKTDEGETLYTLCFNDKKASAIYTTHIVDLANKTLERSKHLSFKAKYTLRGWNLNYLYHAGNQTQAFNEKFIPFTDPETRKNKYFSRNHLTPHADFALIKHQTLTYYFHNCFPGMQSMNVANWSKLEDLVRDLSTQMGKVLRVFTGVYGILKKKTLKGQMMDVYLDPKNERIEVPQIVFKLVVDQKTNDSVAFFTSNDTEMDEQQQNHFATICKSVCDEIAANFNPDVKAGLTVCCRYEDFAKHIQFIPFKLSKSNLLKNPIRIERSNRSKSPSKMTKSKSPNQSPTKRDPILEHSKSDSELLKSKRSGSLPPSPTKSPSASKGKNSIESSEGTKSPSKNTKTSSLEKSTSPKRATERSNSKLSKENQLPAKEATQSKSSPMRRSPRSQDRK